jgi:competence protein ComEA
MSGIPTKRLLVYVFAGLIVLVVGAVGLACMRAGSASGEEEVIVKAAGADAGVADGMPGSVEAAGVATEPSATTTTEVPLIYVQVAGAVHHPGVYQVTRGARVFQAVVEAGGFTDEADQEGIALAAELTDGCRVYVPCVGEEAPQPALSPQAAPADAAGTGTSATATVSLNSATSEQLDSLPGVGPATARQIIAYREAHGSFTSVDQLTDVPGIGPAKLEQLRPLVGL